MTIYSAKKLNAEIRKLKAKRFHLLPIRVHIMLAVAATLAIMFAVEVMA